MYSGSINSRGEGSGLCRGTQGNSGGIKIKMEPMDETEEAQEPQRPPEKQFRLLAVCSDHNYKKISIELYDDKSREWRFLSLRLLKHALRYFRCEFLNYNIILIGGKYPTTTGEQHQIQFADLKFMNLKHARRMNANRSNHAVAVVGEYLYCVGGVDANNECLTSVERYDPYLEVWTYMKPLPSPRAFSATAVVNEKLYVFNGCASSDFPEPLLTTDCYDPATNIWESRAPMCLPSVPLGSTSFKDCIYVVKKDGLERYDTQTDTWDIVDCNLNDFNVNPLSLKAYKNSITMMRKETPKEIKQYDPELNEMHDFPSLSGDYEYGVLLTVPEEYFEHERSIRRLREFLVCSVLF